MAVTSITATTSAARLCNYVLSGTAHDGSGERRYVFASGISCFAPAAAQAFAVTRAVRGQQSIVRQAYSVVQSFSHKEFDMDDAVSAELVHELGLELGRRTFPGHQVLVVTQRDGKSGLLHNHIVVSNISDRDAELVYRRKPRSNSFRDKLALLDQKSPDGLIEVREIRPAGRAFSPAMGNLFRLAHINDELLADEEFMQDLGLKTYDNKALMKTPPEKVTKDDHAKRDKGEYVWRDDLKLIISEEQRRAVSVDDFRDRLAARRVELRERGKEKNFSFGFIDSEGKARQSRALGARGLGESFGRQTTVAMLEANRRTKGGAVKRHTTAAPKPVEVPQNSTVPQVSVPSLLRIQGDLAAPADAPEVDDHELPACRIIMGGDDPMGSSPLEYPRGSAATPKSVSPPSVPARPAQRAAVTRSTDHKRALALMEEQEEADSEDHLLP